MLSVYERFFKLIKYQIKSLKSIHNMKLKVLTNASLSTPSSVASLLINSSKVSKAWLVNFGNSICSVLESTDFVEGAEFWLINRQDIIFISSFCPASSFSICFEMIDSNSVNLVISISFQKWLLTNVKFHKI